MPSDPPDLPPKEELWRHIARKPSVYKSVKNRFPARAEIKRSKLGKEPRATTIIKTILKEEAPGIDIPEGPFDGWLFERVARVLRDPSYSAVSELERELYNHLEDPESYPVQWRPSLTD